MSNNRIAYLNGDYLPLEQAKLSPMDRGFVFGDGIYEVIPVFNGKVFLLEPHIDRLNFCLANIRMNPVFSHAEWQTILEELVRQNGGGDQWIYLQLSRGVEWERTHAIPQTLKPTVFAVSYPKEYPSKSEQAVGIKVTTIRDIRWKHCNVKTTSRLAYVLMYQEIKEAGFDEGIIVNNSIVLEGIISNVFIVRHGVLITPPKSSQLLSGVTRDCVLGLAEANNIPYRETKITERDLLKADELWLTGSVKGIAPVVECSGQIIANGKPGKLWDKMIDLYQQKIQQHCSIDAPAYSAQST